MASIYQTALITGAASGIGRALASALARQGTSIAAVDVQDEGLRALAGEIAQAGGRCAWAVADVTDAAAVRTQVAALEQEAGPMDLAVASAGIGAETSALSYDAEAIARIIQVNLIGVSNTMAAVLPGMLQRRRGHVAAISSVASFRGLPKMLGYSASKSGVNALMDGLRVEVEPYGIHATTICPSWVRTPMTEQVKVPKPDILEVEHAADLILRALHRRRAFYAFPRRMVWRLRFLTWLPRRWQDGWIRRLMRGV